MNNSHTIIVKNSYTIIVNNSYTIIVNNPISHCLNQCWNIVNWAPRNKLQWNYNRNSCIFIQENVFECVVCDMSAVLSWSQYVKSVDYHLRGTSLRPSGDIKRHRSGSTLAQAMACLMAAPSHCLNQYWLKGVQWHSHLKRRAHELNL